MSTTLTLNIIPDDVYYRLRLSAATHSGSLNSAAIVGLETALLPIKLAVAERLARARELRAELARVKFRARDIDALKRQGRP